MWKPLIKLFCLSLLFTIITVGCSSASFEAGEVTAPGVHLEDVKIEAAGNPAEAPKPSETPQ